MNIIKTIVVAAASALMIAGCAGNAGKQVESPVTNVTHPDWTHLP